MVLPLPAGPPRAPRTPPWFETTQIGGFRNSARLRRAHIFDQFLWAQPRNPHPSVAVQASRTMVEPNTLNLRSRWEWPSQQHVVSKGRLVYAIALVLLLPRILIDEATEHCFVRQNRWMLLLLRLFCDCMWAVSTPSQHHWDNWLITANYPMPERLRRPCLSLILLVNVTCCFNWN